MGDKMHLLSYGQQVYSSDERYEMNFHQPNDWQLRIQYANERDEGHYECQVSSHPPVVFHVYLKIIGKSIEYRKLYVVRDVLVVLEITHRRCTYHCTGSVPELEIADERELPIKNKFYNVGSTIELKCVITKVPHQPNTFITWKHGTRILNYDTVRGGIK